MFQNRRFRLHRIVGPTTRATSKATVATRSREKRMRLLFPIALRTARNTPTDLHGNYSQVQRIVNEGSLPTLFSPTAM